MTRRTLIAAIILLTGVPALVGCTGPSAPPRPISVAGDWLVERTIVTSTDEEQSPVGTVETRYVRFVEAECTPSECTGTIASADVLADLGTAFSPGWYTVSEAGEVRYGFDVEAFDCIDPDGEVVAAAVYTDVVAFVATAVADESDPATAVTLEGTGERSYGITPEGETAGCRPQRGVLEYTLTATRAG